RAVRAIAIVAPSRPVLRPPRLPRPPSQPPDARVAGDRDRRATLPDRILCRSYAGLRSVVRTLLGRAVPGGDAPFDRDDRGARCGAAAAVADPGHRIERELLVSASRTRRRQFRRAATLRVSRGRKRRRALRALTV